MYKVLGKLTERKKFLEQLKLRIEKNLETAPEGKLRIVNNRGTIQYYVKNNENKELYPQGQYLKKQNTQIAYSIVQRDYDESLLKKVKDEIKVIDYFLSNYNIRALEAEYKELSDYRKSMVNPWIKDMESYARDWQQVGYSSKAFMEGEQKIYTEKSERVRSKSEKIIADKLYMRGIPYRYEYPLKMKNYGVIYPDFLCFNVSTGKEIYWEHMGMMGNADYSKNALKKINLYTKNGYKYGEDIIFTFESAETPLDTSVIDRIIDTYLN